MIKIRNRKRSGIFPVRKIPLLQKHREENLSHFFELSLFETELIEIPRNAEIDDQHKYPRNRKAKKQNVERRIFSIDDLRPEESEYEHGENGVGGL